jgi:DNA-directed RNA polymerase specialized sigma24 family protein
VVWRGDETELYRELAPVLARRVHHLMRTADEDLVGEACSRAWEIFIARQATGAEVRRESLLAWLTVVAKHEAYRIACSGHEQFDTATGLAGGRQVADVDRIGLWLEVDEALAAVGELPPRMRELLGDRVRGLSYEEIAAARGRSHTNVNHSLARTRERLAQIRTARDSDEHGLARSSPPAARRLDELERRPPAYLNTALGPPPPAGVKHGHAARLAWRRAAALIERYRHEHDITDPARALGEPPADVQARREYQAVKARIERARVRIPLRGRGLTW